MKEVKELKKKEPQDLKKIFEIREKNRPLTALLKNKTGHQQIEGYPQEVDYYLAQDEEKESKLKAEKNKVEKKISRVKGEKLTKKLRRKNDLEMRIKELEKERKRNAFPKYLSYITNNERL